MKPTEASMFGGTLLVVSGPCFDSLDVIRLKISDSTPVACKYLSEFRVSCVTPPIFKTGKKIATLNLVGSAGKIISFTGRLVICMFKYFYFSSVFFLAGLFANTAIT